MNPQPRIFLTPLEHTTQFAPLVALGSSIRDQDWLAPVFSRLTFVQPTHTCDPQAAILDLWVSILAGCRSVSQINTKLRPDRVLAHGWGRTQFREQSTIARVLDECTPTQVAQLRAGVQAVYRWVGQAPHDRGADAPLLIDIDLTEMPAGKQAQGSTKGYFRSKRGLAGGNCVG
jgi:hypothetical protein